ncbi:MAG: ABC transporter substrate-binding protein [Firmicutes bacterium]|nr:ABC transporter substrate-binding protein [Bacillota bacterium]
MKKLGLFLTLVIAMFALTACNTTRAYSDCLTPDGTVACWNATDLNFRWEDGAVVEIGVDSDSMGAALVEKWNADFPALADKLVFRNYGSANGESGGMQGIETAQGEAPDVALVIDNEVTGRVASILGLHDYFADLGSEQTHKVVYDTINTVGTYYLPAFYDGMAFSWNKTMLISLGISLTDANEDGLPDAVDTWEEIFAIADAWTERPTFDGNTILEVFPISLSEVWSGYSSVTAGEWQLFAGGDLADPEFSDAKFKAGLDFIVEFASHAMSVDDTGAKKAASAMGWRWDAYLDGAYPFSLVGTWQDVDGKETANEYDFKFSAMPTYDGVQLTPLMKTKGFVINGYTENPSASSEVLRWLYTKDVMETIVSSSSYLPALETDAAIYPDIASENKAEFALGMRFNTLEPAGSLPNATTIRAMNVYYNINIQDYYVAVWDGTKTPTEAQTELVSVANAWILENNVAPTE